MKIACNYKKTCSVAASSTKNVTSLNKCMCRAKAVSNSQGHSIPKKWTRFIKPSLLGTSKFEVFEVLYNHVFTYLLLKPDISSPVLTSGLGWCVCDTPLNSCLNIHGIMKPVLGKGFLNLKLFGDEGRKSSVYVQCFIMETQYKPLWRRTHTKHSHQNNM